MELQEYEPNLSGEMGTWVPGPPTGTVMFSERHALSSGASYWISGTAVSHGLWIVGVPTQTLSPEAAREKEFWRLHETWRNDTMYVSSATAITSHWAYRRIIALGSEVVPLIVADLRNGMDHWFLALHQLTGYTPPTVNHGNMRKMREAWLRWADENLQC